MSSSAAPARRADDRAAGGDLGALTSKWVTFAASCIVQVCAGLSYSFSIYAPVIKAEMGLSQVEIATVGSAVNFGGYFAIVSGAVYDATKHYHRLGPRLVIAVGSLCCVCGYLGLWMMVSGRAPGGFTELLLFALCAGNAGTWFDTAAIVTNVRNFPNSRGFVVGILKSFLGLSASVYTTIYIAAFEPDATTFLLVLATAPGLICLLLSLLINHVPFVEACETQQGGAGRPAMTTDRRFLLVYCLVGSIALYQCVGAFVVSHERLPPSGRAALATGCLFLVSLVCLVPSNSGSFWAEYGHEHAPGDSSNGDGAATSGGGGGQDAQEEGGAGGRRDAQQRRPPKPPPAGARESGQEERAPLLSGERREGDGEEGAAAPAAPAGAAAGGLPSLSTFEMLCTLDCWCLVLQFCVGTGAALALLNNLGQLVVALGGEHDGQVVLVSLFSVANAAGRLLMGYVPESYLHSQGTPRPAFLVLVAGVMCITTLAAAYSTLAGLYPVAVVLGLMFGSHWSLVPAICSDLFGLAHFGSNYTTLQFAPAMGSFLLATRLTGRLYDKAATAHGDPQECIGPDCFREAFLVLSALAAVSTLACGVVAARSRKIYGQIFKHMHEVEDAERQLSP